MADSIEKKCLPTLPVKVKPETEETRQDWKKRLNDQRDELMFKLFSGEPICQDD